MQLLVPKRSPLPAFGSFLHAQAQLYPLATLFIAWQGSRMLAAQRAAAVPCPAALRGTAQGTMELKLHLMATSALV